MTLYKLLKRFNPVSTSVEIQMDGRPNVYSGIAANVPGLYLLSPYKVKHGFIDAKGKLVVMIEKR